MNKEQTEQGWLNTFGGTKFSTKKHRSKKFYTRKIKHKRINYEN